MYRKVPAYILLIFHELWLTFVPGAGRPIAELDGNTPLQRDVDDAVDAVRREFQRPLRRGPLICVVPREAHGCLCHGLKTIGT